MTNTVSGGSNQIGVIKVVTRGPQGPPGPDLLVTGPVLAGRATGTGKLQPVQLSSDLEFALNGSLQVSDSVLAPIIARLNAFRNANSIYVSTEGNDTNNGTSPGEPLRTLVAAAAAAQPGDVVFLAPGTYTEVTPIRWRRDVTVFGSGLRSTIVKPTIGTQYNDVFKVDSGFWAWGISFAGHQADALTGQQAWAISFDELADNRGIGALGLGAYIFASPYIQNCTSITAEDDSGVAGSQSTGDTGGGIKVDGALCATNSPIRSMVVDSYTQVNLGGPGCLVQNDGYAQLVSFFGTFCTYHVQTRSGGQVNLSGGGTTDFGTYGLIADGYSPSPLYTAESRLGYYGAVRLEKNVTIDPATDLFGCVGHQLVAGDEVTLSTTQGALPSPLTANTTYYVIASGLTSDAFKLSTTEGGGAIDITGTATGSYQFKRQGATVIDVVDLTANRLGRQIKYPTAGSLGSVGQPVNVSSRGGTTPGSSFTLILGTSTLSHEYVGGGTVHVGSTTYPVVSATYDNATGETTIVATGYAPIVGDSVELSGLSFVCNSASRPNTGQLMFPQLVFPRNATTEAPEAKTFAYTRTGNFTLTYSEAPSASGPDHEYVSGGTVVIGGTNYGVANAVYNKTTGVVTITTKVLLPAGNGNVTVNGLKFICPTSAYVVTSSVPINASGVEVANTDPTRAGYRVFFYSGQNGGLLNRITSGQALDFRNRSQIAAPGHTFEYVGSGTNYDALPWNGGIPNPANRVVELNNGRVYTSNTDELGNFAVGDQFAVDGTTGSVTINTDQFNLSGLNAIGPFSRNGGFSTVGVQIREASNNTSLIASTGAPDGNTVPTQFAVKEFVGQRYITNVTATAGQPITLSGAAQVDGVGNWTFERNISLSLNVADGLARLDGSALIPRALLPAATQSAAGSMSATDKTKVDTLGTAAFTNSTAYATAAQGTAADTAFAERLRWDGGATGLNATTGRTSLGLGTSALLDAGAAAGNVPILDGAGKVPSAVLPSYVDDVLEFANLAAFPVSGETGKIYVAIDTGKVYRWGGSTYIEVSPSPGSTDAVPEGSINLYYTNTRASAAAPVQSVAGRTGSVTLSASDVSGLATVATSGAYGDLTGRPTLGTAAAQDVGTSSGNVVQLDGSARLPAVDGSQLTNLPSAGVSIGLAAGLSIALG